MFALSSSRRQFLQTSAALGAATLGGLAMTHAQESAPQATPNGFKKAVKYGMIRAGNTVQEKFQLLKNLGFDGVELDGPSQLNREEVLKARDTTGLVIHGVVDSVHWGKPLSHPDPAVRAAGVAALRVALQDAHAYGATTVLLVPAVVTKEISYADAYQRSQTEIRKVLPQAAELGIKIAIENVWNQFLLSPLEMARYLDELESPLMGAYFDVGNIINYGWPEHWIRTLGKRIFKLDIKEFSRQKRDAEGTRKGFQVELLEGDCDWPAVMKALRDIEFTGWGTAEIPGGDEKRLADIATRMNKIFAS